MDAVSFQRSVLPRWLQVVYPFGVQDGGIGVDLLGSWVASPRPEELKVVVGEESVAPAGGLVPCYEEVVVAVGYSRFSCLEEHKWCL